MLCDVNRLPALHREPVQTSLRLYDIPVEELAGEVAIVRLDFETLSEVPGSIAATDGPVDLADR